MFTSYQQAPSHAPPLCWTCDMACHGTCRTMSKKGLQNKQCSCPGSHLHAHKTMSHSFNTRKARLCKSRFIQRYAFYAKPRSPRLALASRSRKSPVRPGQGRRQANNLGKYSDALPHHKRQPLSNVLANILVPLAANRAHTFAEPLVCDSSIARIVR